MRQVQADAGTDANLPPPRMMEDPLPAEEALMAGVATVRIPAPLGIGTSGNGPFGVDPNPTPFADMPTTEWARESITCIFGLGITTGTTSDAYSPEGVVTREQMAAFLARFWRAGGFECPEGAHPFTDVVSTSFASHDIACIFLLGITTGTSSTTYSPHDLVTRAQMAAFLERLYLAILDAL